MIEDPKALLEIRFMDDWDLGRDRVIGVLFVPKALRDARALVNLFCQFNLVHPDLRDDFHRDPWAEERTKKHAAALRDHPRQYVYPVETIIPTLTPDGQMAVDEKSRYTILYHSLNYRAEEYKTVRRSGIAPFRPHPQKEG